MIDGSGVVNAVNYARFTTAATTTNFVVGSSISNTLTIGDTSFYRVFIADPANDQWIVSNFGGTSSGGALS